MTSEEKISWFAPKILISIIVVICIAIGINYFINEKKYNEATELKVSEQYEEAYKIFNDLGSFKDSKKMKSEIEKSYPYIIKLCVPGDIFILGEYEQDNDLGNGKEPIEWIVLENNDGVIYAISKYVLDVQPFNKTETENCTLDNWLETTFRDNAFQSVPSGIITRAELISEDYYDDYYWGWREEGYGSLTPYVLSLKPEKCMDSRYDDPCYAWWVMPDSGDLENGYKSDSVYAPAGCTSFHSINDFNTVTDFMGVRPAIWLFANAETLPNIPQFSGKSPSYSGNGSSSSSGTCSSCNGTGKKLVEWYTFGDWGDVSYTSYDCPDCNGTGRK